MEISYRFNDTTSRNETEMGGDGVTRALERLGVPAGGIDLSFGSSPGSRDPDEGARRRARSGVSETRAHRRIVVCGPDTAPAEHYCRASPGWSDVRLAVARDSAEMLRLLEAEPLPPDGVVVQLGGEVRGGKLRTSSARRLLDDIPSVALVDSAVAAEEATELGFWATVRIRGEHIGPSDCGRALEVCRALGSGWAHRAYQALQRVHSQLADAHGRLLARSVDAAAGQAMIVHDLRSPLSVMRGVLMELTEAPPDMNARRSEERLRSLMDRACGQLEELVERLEQLHSAEGEPMRRTRVELGALARLVADGVGHAPSGKEKQVTVLASGPCQAMVDRSGIVRVLNNLIVNGLRHARSEVEVRVDGDAEEVRIAVLDDGPGIPEAIRHELFRRYVRHPTAGRLGLGLAIVQRVVERHDGTVEVFNRAELEGEDAAGACFVVRLPLKNRR
jgi:signal transduction histidine kinase